MDVVTYGADARQFFDVHARMGESMLRSERIVARSSANIVSGLFTAQNSAEALANAFLNLEHATKLGLGVAVGVSVGVALYEALKKAKDEADALNEEIRNVIASASGPATYSSLDALIAKLASVREEQKKIQAEANKTFASLAAAIAAHPNLTPRAAVAAQSEERSARNAALRASELETETKIAQKMAETADLEDVRLHVSEQTAAIDKLDADYLEKRATLIRGPGQNLQAVEQLDRLHGLQVEKLATENDLENKKIEEQIKLARIGSDRLEALKEEVRFTAELYRLSAGGSIEASMRAQLSYEKALADAKEETLNREKSLVNTIKQAQREQQSLIIEQAREDIKTPAEKYQELEENNRLYEALRARAWEQGIMAPAPPRYGEQYRPFEGTFAERAGGLRSLIAADFSSLAALAGLDFSGLIPLSGLTIIVR
jgi:hypothetical protein